MSSNSFKQMIKEGTIKRADAMKVAPADLHIEPGFNERTEGAELEASIAELRDYILAGGTLPPLEVRARAEGGVWIVDGHRRQRAYLQAIEAGAPIEWIEVRPFVGNDADRLARIVSSNGGLQLTPLETSRVYKRLAAFGLSPSDIAAKVGKTRAHVEQLMTLANADIYVQSLVAAGTVSASVAVETVRKHGDGASSYFAGQVEKAKSAGKDKVTTGSIEGKPLPRRIVFGVLSTVEAFTATLSSDAHKVMSGLKLGETRTVEVDAEALLKLVGSQLEVADAREAQAEKLRRNLAKQSVAA